MAKRDRSASLTQLLAEATTDGPVPEPKTEPSVEPSEKPAGEEKPRAKETRTSEAAPPTGGSEAKGSEPTEGDRRSKRQSEEPTGTSGRSSAGEEQGHVRYSDGSYLRADGERRVALQLKMRADDKQALKVQAAAAGLSPAEYVARLVREDAR